MTKLIIAKKKKITRAERKSMGNMMHRITEVDGIRFDSAMEAQYYELLKELKASGHVRDFSIQPPFLLQEKFMVVEGKTIWGSDKDFAKLKRKHKAPTIAAISYISDFDVTYADGTREIVDVKGILTPEFRIKQKMFQCRYPELSLVLKTFDDVEQRWITPAERAALVKARKKVRAENKAQREKEKLAAKKAREEAKALKTAPPRKTTRKTNNKIM